MQFFPVFLSTQKEDAFKLRWICLMWIHYSFFCFVRAIEQKLLAKMYAECLYRYSVSIQNEHKSKNIVPAHSERTKRINFDSIWFFSSFSWLCRAYSIYFSFFSGRKTIRFISISCLINRSNSCFLPSHKNKYTDDRRLLEPQSNFFFFFNQW